MTKTEKEKWVERIGKSEDREDLMREIQELPRSPEQAELLARVLPEPHGNRFVWGPNDRITITHIPVEAASMLTVDRDKQGQPMIEWHQANGGWKRAWIQRRTDPMKDWAAAPDGRYLNVVRIQGPKQGPAGNATDFPIFSDLADEQILMSFVYAISSVTGCPIK